MIAFNVPMRVIAGIHRSRMLLGPDGEEVTRPITDRVKQSLFDRLTSMGVLGYGTAVDVFAGTGSLGIEALSRGTQRCVFVERDRTAVDRLTQNLNTLRLTEQADVLRVDALATRWFERLPEGEQVPIMFIDPPYALTEEQTDQDESQEAEPQLKTKYSYRPDRQRVINLMEELAGVVEPGGVLVIRTSGQVPAPLAQGWGEPTTFIYGKMGVHLYEK